MLWRCCNHLRIPAITERCNSRYFFVEQYRCSYRYGGYYCFVIMVFFTIVATRRIVNDHRLPKRKKPSNGERPSLSPTVFDCTIHGPPSPYIAGTCARYERFIFNIKTAQIFYKEKNTYRTVYSGNNALLRLLVVVLFSSFPPTPLSVYIYFTHRQDERRRFTRTETVWRASFGSAYARHVGS